MSKKTSRSDEKRSVPSYGKAMRSQASKRQKIVFTVCNPTGMPAPIPTVARNIQMPPAACFGMFRTEQPYLPPEEDEEDDY